MRYFILSSFSLLIFTAFVFKTEEKLPDLVITKIDFPKWDTISKNMYSYICVTIKNVGEAPSVAVKVKLGDLDISYVEAKKLKLSKEELSVVKDEERLRNDDKQDDAFFSIIESFQGLKPGEEGVLVFVVKQWLFDPDIDVEAEVDPGNFIREKNEKNNKRCFFLNG